MTPSLETLKKVYGETEKSGARFEHIAQGFAETFGAKEPEFFTSPGRTEIVGNHTDHNCGKVLAGSITLDTIGAAASNGTEVINILSEGYPKITVDINAIDSVKKGSGTVALLAGMVEGTKNFGFNVHGFDAYVTTEVIPAAGVSSSASFEMLVMSIIDYLFNDSKMDFKTYAKIGQYSENHFWLKSSGLMDQMACAVGGPVLFDFSGDVSYEKVDFDYAKFGHDLVIVNTGKGHADLSSVYSEVPAEMKAVAQFFGKNVVREITMEDILDNYTELREKLGNDRCILRAIHFLKEDERVENLAKAASENDGATLLNCIKESGRSSWELLQNVYPIHAKEEQPVALALALTENFLDKKGRGVCRIHGGGFAGVIAAITAKEDTAEYVEYISRFFGAENVYPMQIRAVGAAHLDK